MKRIALFLSVVLAAACAGTPGPLPRAKASANLDEAFASYLQAVADSAEDLHSVMVLQHGKVLEEKFFVPDTAHILNSVSKTFTSTAVGFAITEGLLHLDDKIVDLFPESHELRPRNRSHLQPQKRGRRLGEGFHGMAAAV